MAEYYQGLGRRKTSCARVRLYRGEEGFVVNGKPATEFFSRVEDMATCMLPLQVAERLGQYAVSVKVEGGGVSGQAGAVRHGVARALLDAEPELRPVLKQAGLLTRDPRVKERKKPGLKRARKAPQYTKR